MRICFSLQPGPEKEMHLSEHFGESDTFIIYDTDQQVFTPHACHAALCKGPCHCHLPALAQGDFDAVICRNIGARAFAALRRFRITVLLTQSRAVQQALSEWRTQGLPMAQKGVCRPEFITERTQKTRRRTHGATA